MKQMTEPISVEQWLGGFQGEEREKRLASAIDFFKACANSYAQNFLSLRGLEWTSTYQLLAGLALIGAGYSQMPIGLRSGIWPSAAFIGLATIITAGWFFLGLQIQRRLHWTRSMENAYLDGIHKSLLCVPKPASPPAPQFQRWYAFATQVTIAVAVYLSVAMYIWYLR